LFTYVPCSFLGGPFLFHRATLLDILVAKIPSDRVHFNKRLASYSESGQSANTPGEVTLHFTDGATAVADVLVGCDGIKSVIRRQMYTSVALETGASAEEYAEKYGEAAWSGILAYRSPIPAEALRNVNPNHWVFKSPHAVSISL
jgi:salicylate hydroxylase